MVKSRERKSGLEQYYTPTDTAEYLVGVCRSIIPNFDSLSKIEPSAGNGSFLNLLTNCKGYDIEPNHPDVIQKDYLTGETVKADVVIGNPPFGRACSLATKFINRAAYSEAKYIAFILPKSFRKWTIINRIDLSFHLIHDKELDVNYVDNDGQLINSSGKLNTVFQIWRRSAKLREKIVVEDRGIIKKVSAEEANAVITLFGRNCGTVFTGQLPPPTTCLGFFKVREDVLPLLKDLEYSRFFNNVSFTPALSISEIRYLIHEKLWP